MKIHNRFQKRFVDWLIYEPPPPEAAPCDFLRLKTEIQPGDVLLIEGQSRVSKVIRTITQSPWTHAALYVGRLAEIEDDSILELASKHINIKPTKRIIFESLMDQGATLSPLNLYRHHHIRICRPIGITRKDVDAVIRYAFGTLGKPYNMRQIFDLARFVLPWKILPRRWGSSLFKTGTGQPEAGICSTLIAEAFTSVQFPILPFMKSNEEQTIEFFQRNPYLFTPKDFDYSPYFDIIKYPLFSVEEPLPYYRRLPWNKEGLVHHGNGMVEKRHIKSEN